MSRYKKLIDIDVSKNIGELFDIKITMESKTRSGLVIEYKNSIFVDYNNLKYFFLVSNCIEVFDLKEKIYDVYVKYSVKVQ